LSGRRSSCFSNNINHNHLNNNIHNHLNIPVNTDKNNMSHYIPVLPLDMCLNMSLKMSLNMSLPGMRLNIPV
jgi:hypothetical protein